MNIFSRNIFAIAISGVLCLGTITPVLAISGLRKRKAWMTDQRIRRIHSDGVRKPKATSALNGEKTPLSARPELNQQNTHYRTPSVSKNETLPNDGQVNVNGTTLRISFRKNASVPNENKPASIPVALPNALKVNVLPLSTPQLNPGYTVKAPNGQICGFLGASTQNKENTIIVID